MIAVPLIIAVYLFSTAAALYRTDNWAAWTSGSFAGAGKIIGGGVWLGAWVSVAAMLGTASQLSTMICSCSRIPYTLSVQGFLPRWFAALHPRSGVPWFSILFCSALIAILCCLSFQNLVEIDIFLYIFLIIAEFVSFMVLKIREPGLVRPVCIPWGIWGAVLLAIPPGVIIVLSIITGPMALLPVFGLVVLIGLIVYWVRPGTGRRDSGGEREHVVKKEP